MSMEARLLETGASCRISALACPSFRDASWGRFICCSGQRSSAYRGRDVVTEERAAFPAAAGDLCPPAEPWSVRSSTLELLYPSLAG